MSLNYNIDFKPGTEKQVSAGIMGRATVEVVVGGKTLIRLSDMLVRRKKDDADSYWVQYPAQESTTKKDENGYPVKYPYYFVFPNKDDADKRDDLHRKIIEAYKATGSNPSSSNSKTTSTSKSSKASSVKAPPPPAAKDDWSMDD